MLFLADIERIPTNRTTPEAAPCLPNLLPGCFMTASKASMKDIKIFSYSISSNEKQYYDKNIICNEEK